jgi:O-antigen/teichoic acid export membrane protein
MKDLKRKALHGGAAKICSQAASFVVRLGSLMILARLVNPRDFGLVGMVTSVIGVFNVFRDFGLSAAAVQRNTAISDEQASTLFWINLLVGTILGLLSVAMAPFAVLFYHEPRLLGVTAALASGFVFNGAGVQHSAILERQMRFVTLSVIDVVSLLISVTVAIVMALRGYGYWALVVTATLTPLAYTVCVWLTTGWIPGRPRKRIGVRSMMRFGGTLTLNGLVMYIATNFDKVLLGRFWGANAIGIYGRAYQLVNIPTDNLNSAAGGVAFATLSRVQDNPSRFRSYFLKGYALVLSLTVPVTVASALFATEIITVFLGPKWKSAIVIFRLLAPTALAFAIINPIGWLLVSLGLVGRGLKMSLVLAPIMISGYALGLSRGPQGVAFAYSGVMLLCTVPLIAWALHGTPVSIRDVLVTVSRPLFAGIVAGMAVFVLHASYARFLPQLLRLAVGVALLLAGYLGMLLFVMGQRSFYIDLLRGFRRRASSEEEVVVSA